MSINVSEVRSETQIPATIITDDDIEYAIDMTGANGLYSVCSFVLRMVLRKYRGRTRIRIGNIWESIDPSEIRALIRGFDSQSGVSLSDGIQEPDPFFTRDGI